MIQMRPLAVCLHRLRKGATPDPSGWGEAFCKDQKYEECHFKWTNIQALNNLEGPMKGTVERTPSWASLKSHVAPLFSHLGELMTLWMFALLMLKPCKSLDPCVDDLHPLLVGLHHLPHPLSGQVHVVLLGLVRTSGQDVLVRDLRIEVIIWCNLGHLWIRVILFEKDEKR